MDDLRNPLQGVETLYALGRADLSRARQPPLHARITSRV
jgi:hypothetical protein